jgi:nitric oxide synthase oxygenase domain/subunit
MSLVYYPMLRQEKFICKAQEFYHQVQIELGWSETRYQKCMIEIEHEIASTGTYTQTTEEIEAGTRLAWRNYLMEYTKDSRLSTCRETM